MKVGANDLNRFLNKLKKIEKVEPQMALAIAKRGVEIAEKEYAVSGFPANISIVEHSKEEATIEFSGDGISFHEFGTGYYAQNTYPDESKLPKSGVPITGSWQYYYDNSFTKTTINGEKGWIKPNGEFTIGQPAHAEIYYTALQLRQEMANIAKDVYKNGVKK